MHMGRRDFLKQLSAFLAGGFARSLAAGTATAATGAAAVTAANAAPAAGAIYGTTVRARVFEVIVRQGLAGAPWKDICAGPMQVNAITENEVQDEIDRRRQLMEADPEYQRRKREREEEQRQSDLQLLKEHDANCTNCQSKKTKRTN